MARYIDAELAESTFRDTYCQNCTKWCPSCDIDCVISDLDDIPTADVTEVKHGYWVPNPIHKEWDYCSNCNMGTKRREYGLNFDGSEYVSEYCYLYCPNCGALMDEEVSQDVR